MIGLDGEKMSKSKGNLVFVSQLIADGRDPMAIRWALMKDHYRTDRMWTEQLLIEAEAEISALRLALHQVAVAPTTQIVQRMIELLANDLDTQSVTESINEWVAQSLGGNTGGDTQALVVTLDALLGIRL